MILTLNEKGVGGLIDLTQYFLEKNKIIFTPEYERDLFEKTVEDIHLVLSDLDDTFTNFFYNQPATTVWQVRLSDGGRTLFLGEVLNSSILVKLKAEQFELDVFSILKTFWDRTKVYPIFPNPSPAEESIVYTTLGYIMKRELGRRSFSDLYGQIIIPSDLAARPIRGWANDPGLGIGNNGRYRELAGSYVVDPNDPYRIVVPSENTKVYDLLDGFARYYNAQFVIDYDQNALVMKKRSTPLNPTPVSGGPINIDAILMDDEEPEAQIYGEDVYDYVHVPRFLAPSQPPVFEYAQKFSSADFITDKVSYVCTEIQHDEDTGANFELPASVPVTVDVKGILGTTGFKSVKIVLRIPDGSLQIGANGKRVLYRTKQGGGEFYPRMIFDALTPNVVFIDAAPNINVGNGPPSHLQTHMVWMRYDEATAEWSEFIDNRNGTDPPDGKILEVLPRLQFREIKTNNVRPYSSFDVVAFFGLEATDTSFALVQREAFKDLFITKHRVTCNVESTNVKAGDAAVASGLASPFLKGTMMLKKAEVDLINEKSRLELLSR